MVTASKALVKVSRRLFSDPAEQEQFVDALLHPMPFAPAIVWCRPRPGDRPFAVEPPLPWQPGFVDRLPPGDRPGQHPLHQQGYFYCLDFSSVFAASVLLTIPHPVQHVLDMCASPGGKSVFAWLALHPNSLLSNEVIGKRLGALVSNLRRCIAPGANDLNQQVTLANLDSERLAQAIPNSTDVVFVDAPCTGQSLLAKGEDNPGCFHPVTINRNANRQKRILANAAQIVCPGGYLAYMTCAYSQEENEAVMDWFLHRFPHFQPVAVAHLDAYQSHLSDRPCYRMFPHHRLGAGAFTTLLQNTATGQKQAWQSSFLTQPGLIPIRAPSP